MTFARVYLVDDEKFDRLLYKRVIDRAGMARALELFVDGEDALEAVRAASTLPDLILLDINMPRMNGFEFLQAVDAQLAAADPPCIVAILSTSQDPKDKDRARQFRSVRHFFTKPLRPEFLMQIAETRARGG